MSMEIITAKTAGFCMGVRRAVDMALAAAQDATASVYSLGSLIHNRQVVDYLAEKGIAVAKELPTEGTVIIRAHGVGPETINALKSRGITVIDATCPHVLSSQRIIARESAKGLITVIAGDRAHPEVVGLAGHSHTPVHIISSIKDAQTLKPGGAFFLIAQTTFMHSLYAEITKTMQYRFPESVMFDSICDATEKRQNEVRALALECEVLIVAGGRESANTKRLAEIGQECGIRVLLIETADELEPADFIQIGRVGLTAGASTPDWVIHDIQARLKSFSE